MYLFEEEKGTGVVDREGSIGNPLLLEASFVLGVIVLFFFSFLEVFRVRIDFLESGRS
jgi:hypothetical protein